MRDAAGRSNPVSGPSAPVRRFGFVGGLVGCDRNVANTSVALLFGFGLLVAGLEVVRISTEWGFTYGGALNGVLSQLAVTGPAAVLLALATTANVLAGAALKPAYAQKGVRLHRMTEASLSFTFFNMDDPVVGGYTPERIALRRAIVMAYNTAEEVAVLRNGQGVPATQLVPPTVPGHDPKFAQKGAYDPAAARALLDRFGFRDRDGDGYREMPDGTPLVLVKGSTPSTADRNEDELWKRNLDAVGIRITFLKQKWPELNKMTEAGQLQMWGLSWISAIPDGDSFVSPLYSRNIGTSNDARLRLPEYDALYERSRALPNGPERTTLFLRMTEIVLNYAPWKLGLNPYANVLAQPWLKGYKQHPFFRHQWKYYDVGARP